MLRHLAENNSWFQTWFQTSEKNPSLRVRDRESNITFGGLCLSTTPHTQFAA